MPTMPKADTPSGGLIRVGITILASVRADDDVSAFGDELRPAQAALRKAMTGRVEADDDVLEAEGVLGFHRDGTERAIMTLGTKAFGHFESRSHKEFLRIYPEAPSMLISKATNDTRRKTFDDIVAAALDKSTPKELGGAVKALHEVHRRYAAADDDLAAKKKLLEKASENEDAAREAWFVGLRRLVAKLNGHFAEDPSRVDAYFPRTPAPRKKKKAETPPAAPAPTTPLSGVPA